MTAAMTPSSVQQQQQQQQQQACRRPRPGRRRQPAAAGIIGLLLVALLFAASPGVQALDPCLSRPWTAAAPAAAPTVRTLQLASFDDLQPFIDRADGPTTFVIDALRTPLPAGAPVVVSKPDITIAAGPAWLSSSGSSGGGGSYGLAAAGGQQRLAVACGGGGPLLRVRGAAGTTLLGLDVSGCSGGAVQLQGARRAVLRGCRFAGNANGAGGGGSDAAADVGGGAIVAAKSQLWLDGCVFEDNAATAGSGGAVAATASQLLVSGGTVFARNSAGTSGGAVALVGAADASLTSSSSPSAAAAAAGECWASLDAVAEGAVWADNAAKLHGGALACNGSRAALGGADARGNTARYGGAAYVAQAGALTVRSGSAFSNNTAGSSGGVAYVVSPGAALTLSGSSFDSNRALILGGVVTAKDAALVKLDGCAFTNNSADLAAGVLYGKDADLVASGCAFSGNRAQRDGGALYCAGGCGWQLRACTFADNECSANGGAMFGWNADVSVADSSMDGNAAGALGGAVSLANSTLAMRGCRLSANSAYGSDAAGGGVYGQGSRLALRDCLLSANTASWGGGCYVTNSTLEFVGGAVTNSSVSGSGGAMYVLRSVANLTGVSLGGNAAAQFGGSLYCHGSACQLTGVDAAGESAGLGAGGVWAGLGSSLALWRCHLLGCSAAAEDGGCVSAQGAAAVSVVGSSFKGCSALRGAGGALSLRDVPSATVRGSLFAANAAAIGGALHASNATVSVGGSSLINSTATVGGGVAASGGGALRLFNGTAIAGNAAAVGGGLAADGANVTVEGPVAVSWNRARRPSVSSSSSSGGGGAVPPTATFGGQPVLRGLGGGLYLRGGRLLAQGLRLERNAADRVGGGAYADGAGLRLSRSSVARNTAGEEGGGAKLVNPRQGSSLTAVNVTGNWAGGRGGGLALVGVDLVSELALVATSVANNTAAGRGGGGGVWVHGPLGVLMVGGSLEGNAAGAGDGAEAAAAAADADAASAAFGAGDLAPAGGGALFEGCSWAALRGVDVWGNAAPTGCGGGVAVDGCGRFALDGALVQGNVAASGGGLCAANVKGPLELHNSSVLANRALLGGSWLSGADGAVASLEAAALAPPPEPHLDCRVAGTGGGLCVQGAADVLLNGTTLARNTARNGGGAALGLLCADPTACSLGLVGATFANNTAVQGGGGAVYFTSNLSPEQVLCGGEYANATAAAATAAGVTPPPPSLAALLASATFGTSDEGAASAAAAAATAAPVVPAPAAAAAAAAGGGTGSATGGSGGGGDDVLASTSGAMPSTDTFVPGSSDGMVGSDTVTFDSVPVDMSTSGYDGSGGAVAAETQGALPSGDPASALRVSGASGGRGSSSSSSSSASPPPPSSTAGGSGSSGDGVVEATEGFVPGQTGSGGSSSSSTDVDAATAGFDPTSSAATGPGAADTFVPGGADTFVPGGSSGETAGFDPTGLLPAGGDLYTIASMPERRPSPQQAAAALGEAQRAFQDRSRRAAAAGGSSGSSSTAGGGATPRPAGQAAPAPHTRRGAAARAGVPAPAAASAAAAQQQQQQQQQQQHVGSMRVPEAGAAPPMGTVVWALADATQALRTTPPPREHQGSAPLHVSPPATAQAAQQQQAAAASADDAAATESLLHAAAAAAGDVPGWTLLHGAPHAAAAGCDPVQRPQGCPPPRVVPATQQQRQQQQQRQAAGGATQAAAAVAQLAGAGGAGAAGTQPRPPAAAAAAPAAAVAVVASPAKHHSSASAAATAAVAATNASGGGGGHRRMMLQLQDDADAAAAATAASGAATQLGAQPPPSSSSGALLLSGSSQCGAFVGNGAVGARAYGPVVTSRPAGLRVWDAATGDDGSGAVSVPTGGPIRVQVSVVDVFGGAITSGAADSIRVRATLHPPGSAAGGLTKALIEGGGATGTTGTTGSTSSSSNEVDDNGVVLSGTQQLSSGGGGLLLSGLRLSGSPGANATLYILPSDPTLAPASVPVSLTRCSAGYMLAPGACQLCPPGTFSFNPDDAVCSLCPAGATCNGTVLVPASGGWHSSPRSAQVHACPNPAACKRDGARQAQLADWQAAQYGRGPILGRTADAAAEDDAKYMQLQCAPTYTGRLCATCAQEPAAAAANRASHGRVNGACVECGARGAVVGLWLLARLFDMALWAALTWLAWRAARAWGEAVTLNPGVAAATAGSLAPGSAAAAALGPNARVAGSGDKPGQGVVLAGSSAAAAAAAGVGAAAPLHAHVSAFVDFLHMLSVVACATATYGWPARLNSFLAGFAFVPLGTSRWVPSECLLPLALSYRRSVVGLLLNAAPPLLYLLVSASLWIGGIALGRTIRTPILALVVGTGLFYPLVALSSLSVFSCVTLDGGAAAPGEQLAARGSYWALDPDLRCYEGQHLQLTLGFGLPVVLLVVFAWPMLLSSMLWDSRFRVREQQTHPATRRRYLVRKTIKLCHQLLGVEAGFSRPKAYLWPVVAELRKLALCVVVVLSAGAPAAAQLYGLWGLFAALLALEWLMRPALTRPLMALQLAGIATLQAVVYLASGFTQASLAGAAPALSGLIMALCALIAAFFLATLAAGLRAPLARALDLADADGKGLVSGADLAAVAASKLLHLNYHHPHQGGEGKEGGGGDGSTGSGSGGSGGSSAGRLSSLIAKLLRRPGALADAALGVGRHHPHGGAAAAGVDAAGAAGAGADGLPTGRAGRSLVAGSLPIADAAAAAAAAAGDGTNNGGVATSASIDIGALDALRAQLPSGAFAAITAAAAAAAAARNRRSSGGSGGGHVAVDLAQLSSRSAGAALAGGGPGDGNAAPMARANSVGHAAPPNMPLHSYMSVQRWLQEAAAGDEAAAARAGGGAGGGGGLKAAAAAALGRGGALHGASSTPAPAAGALPLDGRGSLAVQRAQLLAELQHWQRGGVGGPTLADADDDSVAGFAPGPSGLSGGLASGSSRPKSSKRVAFADDGDADADGLRSVSQSERSGSQPPPPSRATGLAAAHRARELAGTTTSARSSPSPAAAAAASPAPHSRYIAMWSNVASAIAGGSGSVGSSAAPPPAAAAGASFGSSVGAGGPAAAAAAAVAAALRIPSVSSSTVKPSPFAAPAAAAAVLTGRSAALSTPEPSGPPVRSVSLPARPSLASRSPFAAPSVAAAAAGVAAPSPGRHAAYITAWHAAAAGLAANGGDVDDDGAYDGGVGGGGDAYYGEPAAAAAAPGSPPVQRSRTAPPAVLVPPQHRQYYAGWAALADELGEGGPSAVGAPAPGPVLPPGAAEALAALSASASAAAAPPATPTPGAAPAPPRGRASPFASNAAAIAAALGVAAAPAAVEQQPQQQQQRGRVPPRRRRRVPRDSAGTAMSGDDEPDGAAAAADDAMSIASSAWEGPPGRA